MWWDSGLEIYLGTDLMLVRVPGKPVQEQRFDAGCSPDAMLTEVDGTGGRGPVQFHLSAARCPAMDIAYPVGMRRFRDRELFARAVCADRLGLQADAVHVALDPSTPGIAAVMRQELRAQLEAWAHRCGRRVASIRPLWAVASGAAPARRKPALRLREADALTLVGAAEHSSSVTHRALSMRLERDASPAQTLTRLHRSLDIPPEQAIGLLFGLDGPRGSVRMPAWAGCWGVE